MDWLIEVLRTNVAPPWLLWGAVYAAAVSTIPVAYVLATRKFRDKRKQLYLGVYTAFWAGEGICFMIVEAITSHVMDGRTPQSFYAELWFYLVLAVIIWPATIFVTERFEDDAERRGCPESIRNWPSQKAHNRVCLPTVIYFTVWSALPVVDFHEPLWSVPVFLGIIIFWWGYLTFIRDGDKMPQTELEWTRFHPVVMMLALGLSAVLQFA